LRRRQETVLKEFQDIQNATEAYSAYGVYDIVARIEAETMDKLKDRDVEGAYGDLRR
jgi:DNA-binding Lrp family transcriptional regulator